MREKIVSILFIIISAALWAPTGSALGQEIFSGSIKFRDKDENGIVTEISYYSKGGKIRMDMTNTMGKMYWISDGKNIDLIMPAQKMYMESSDDLNNNFSSSESTAVSPNDNKGKDWKKVLAKAGTGKTRKILGHLCHEYVLPNGNGDSMHIWAAADVGDIQFVKSPMGQNPLQSEINKMGSYFPMMSEEYNSDGKVVNTFEVTEMNKGNVDDSVFEIPAGYEKMSVPGMK